MKTKNIRGGYILISLGMVDISADSPSLEIDFSRLTSSKKSIRLCNINIDGEHKPDINIQPSFGEDSITLSDVYGYDLIVSDDNSVEVTEHRSAYELPIPEVSDAGKTIIVDSEGKYGLDDMPNELPIPEVSDAGKTVVVNSEGKYALSDLIEVITINGNLNTIYEEQGSNFRGVDVTGNFSSDLVNKLFEIAHTIGHKFRMFYDEGYKQNIPLTTTFGSISCLCYFNDLAIPTSVLLLVGETAEHVKYIEASMFTAPNPAI